MALQQVKGFRAVENVTLSCINIDESEGVSRSEYFVPQAAGRTFAGGKAVMFSWRTRRRVFDALSREARRPESITLHCSAQVRHQFCSARAGSDCLDETTPAWWDGVGDPGAKQSH